MAKPRRMSVVDRVGERHGRLKVIARAANRQEPSGAIRAFWVCQCDCGGQVETSGQSLSRGSTRSCGCLIKEARSRETTHGKSGTSLYRIWNTMRQRCSNPASTHYASYGGRGVSVCDRWSDFENFAADVGERPRGGTLDRIDNNGNYEPGNVRWATRLVQANNRRTNVRIALDGEEKTIAEWSRHTGIPSRAIRKRLSLGWPAWRILTERTPSPG